MKVSIELVPTSDPARAAALLKVLFATVAERHDNAEPVATLRTDRQEPSRRAPAEQWPTALNR